MEQVIIAGAYNLLHSTNTEYQSISSGSSSWKPSTSEHYVAQCISSPGKLKNLRVELNDSPGEGKSYTFTIRLNRATDTSLEVVIADTDTSGADTGEIDVSAGDVVSIKCVPSGTPTARYAQWSLVFEGTNAKESLLLSGIYCYNASSRYNPILTGTCTNNATEANTYCIAPTSGKIKNLYVDLDVDPGTSPDAHKITLRKNGESQTLTCTITANDKTGNDTAHEVTIAAGDRLNLMCEPLNSPSVSCRAAIGMTFVADTDGESILASGSDDDLHNTDTEYNKVLTGEYSTSWDATEAQQRQLAQACTLKSLYVYLTVAPGAGNNYALTLMKNGIATALTCTIADADTTGNDTAHEVEIADDDNLSLRCVPDSTPDASTARWGIVCLIAAAVDYPISLSPGLTVSSTVAYKAAWDRGTSPGLTISATILKGWGRAIATTANLTISTTILKAKGWKITTTAGLTISATVSKALAWTRTHSPGLTASATVDRDVAWDRGTSPGLTAAVIIAYKAAWNRAVNSGLTISATVLRVFGRTIVTTAGLTVSATVGRVVAWSKSLTPGLTASATVVRVLGYTKAITAGLTVAVSIKVFWDWVKFLLKKRVIDFTLPERTMDFTLPKRTVDFTLRDRSE